MSRRRCFYIWDMSRRRYIWKISKNDQVCRIWAGYGKYGKIDEKVIFLQKLMFLNCLNGYLFVAFRLQYFAQVFTIDWMRIPPNIKFIHSPNLKLWINVLHANFLKNLRKLPNFNINFEYEAGIFIKKVKILKYSASDFLLNCTKMTSLQSTVGAQQNF